MQYLNFETTYYLQGDLLERLKDIAIYDYKNRPVLQKAVDAGTKT